MTHKKELYIFILFAFIFSIAIRLIWVYQFHDNTMFMWNDQFMINTNDGYYWAEGARDILAGGHQPNDLSPVDMAPAMLTALFAKVFPFSFETIIFYMPAVLGSLIVIPIILIGHSLKEGYTGILAAFIGSITYSYYNRTMIGYYDTDMLNIVLPLAILWGMMVSLINQQKRYLFLTTALVVFYSWWYNSSYTLNVAMGLGLLAYTLIFERNKQFNYLLIAFYLLAISQIALVIKIPLILTFFVLLWVPSARIRYFEYILLGVGSITFLAMGGIDPIISLFQSYVVRGGDATASQSALHFYNVMETVREAGHVPFDVLAQRWSGHVLSFAVGLIGYILLVWRYPILLLSLPLFGLGIFAIWGGLRFTIYAVPFFALGIGYVIILITRLINANFARVSVAILLVVLALTPNILHIIDYKVPPVMQASEVSQLVELQRTTKRNDYVVTWWDYGYPIRYYADMKTWIDGGKHSGDVNFPASFVLTAQDQTSAANMLRLYTEYTEKRFADTNKSTLSDFEYMMNAQGDTDPDNFLSSLTLHDYKLPPKKHDVYLYLPFRMMEIFPTVAAFSTIDLKNPSEPNKFFFYNTTTFNDQGNIIDLGNNIQIMKKNNSLKMGSDEVPIKSFYQVGYDENRQLRINEQIFASEGLNIILLPSYGQCLIVDDFYFNSTYIQMFIFERYDPNLFEPVNLDPIAKIYKLKI